jgi:Protein of unknown function (DUF1761)
VEILNVLVAAIAAFAFGAVWYMSMSKPWMEAAGIAVGADGRPVNSADKTPFIIGLIGMVLCAGMMRHIFIMAAIDTVGKGLLSGLGIGAFLVGCGIIGLVLTLF